MDKVIISCKTFGAGTQFIFGGPLPAPGDGRQMLSEIGYHRRWFEDRLEQEPSFHYLRVGERFGNVESGINHRLMCEEGLTIRGCEVLRRDVQDLLEELSRH